MEAAELDKLQRDLALPAFAIGPLHKHDTITPETATTNTTPNSCTLKLLERERDQDRLCMEWLDLHPPKSVLYVSFGSLASMDSKDFTEMAWGLANSSQPFLWVVRSGSVESVLHVELALPDGFRNATHGFKLWERCGYLHSWSIGDTFSLITPLKGHKKVISAIALPSGSDKLYSGSKDGTVKVWDCQTGKCVETVCMGREVGCMISVEPWLFVGMPDSIKVWNTQTGAEMSLSGPTGQVYALVAANDMLFAGTHDGRILVWRYSAPTNCFEPAASLLDHSLAVISLVVGGTLLYSGSMDKTIKVWDLTTLQCVQTLSGHTNVVMSLLYSDQFLFSCSLDSTVKIWCTRNNKEHLEVIYTHVEEHGVIALCGMQDLKGKPVLMCSLSDNSVHLYDFPSFNKKGTMFAKQKVRTMQTGPGGIFFTGDGIGELKVWKWSM